MTEAAWLLRHQSKALANLMDYFAAGVFRFLYLADDDLIPIYNFIKRYQQAQLADATLLHLAERENTKTIFTLDRGDFSIYRVNRDKALQLVP
jgi:predicted nucleic acid-binding protein